MQIKDFLVFESMKKLLKSEIFEGNVFDNLFNQNRTVQMFFISSSSVTPSASLIKPQTICFVSVYDHSEVARRRRRIV